MLTISLIDPWNCYGIVAFVVAAAVAIGSDDEYDEVDDLEEMHMAIVNNDYDQVCSATFCFSWTEGSFRFSPGY